MFFLSFLLTIFQKAHFIMHSSQTTIFALSTASGRAGVSIIRVSGPAAKDSMRQLCAGSVKPRYASLQKIIDYQDKSVIDEGLVLWFPAPHSFTGEDCVEFQIHGSVAVIQKMLEILAQFHSYKLAEPGEFARRAFENGRLDLTEVEGLSDLINAETEAQRQQAVRQSSGALGKIYTSWRHDLIKAMTLLTAAIDFSDEEDIADDIIKQVQPMIMDLSGKIKDHLEDGHRGEIIRHGYQVVLAGLPNVGKSSLLNALAQRNAAIVSDEAGTTRDIIQVTLDLDGIPIIVMDTAGLRETSSLVEQEGIRRTIQSAEEANLIIWLMDATAPVYDLNKHISKNDNVLFVLNKVDLLDSPSNLLLSTNLALSLKKDLGLDTLIKEISKRAKTELTSNSDPVITRQRHRSELENCQNNLAQFLSCTMEDIELRAEDLRLAASSLGRITGEIDVEDLLDLLFSEFCIGK